MTKLPSLTPIQVIRKLKTAGFVFDRQAKGSHEIWYNPETILCIVVERTIGTITIVSGRFEIEVQETFRIIDYAFNVFF